MVEDSREMAHIPYSSVVNRVDKMHETKKSTDEMCKQMLACYSQMTDEGERFYYLCHCQIIFIVKNSPRFFLAKLVTWIRASHMAPYKESTCQAGDLGSIPG